ncbi:unnamed protein product [Paramecium sonneborni]|uniref:Uncharacterized protein n=1 Tax=Paramecium sonneborni TaxID=65129 RepID=A0A8S1P790_9CILI|nr:unnamed protein product [Paramecium sonneborni]
MNISDELKQLMETEKNDLIQIQKELYLFLTQTSCEMAPNNKNEREEIIKDVQVGQFHQQQLFESFFKGACQLQKIYSFQNRRQYEVYFQIDILQWEIISYFQKERQKNLEEVLLEIQNHIKILFKIQINGQIIFVDLIDLKNLNQQSSFNKTKIKLSGSSLQY